MALPTVHRDVVDGVPTFWVESGRPTVAAALVFRCGIADETLPTTGWTHLVEHLALHDRERGTLSVNGSTSLLRTSFEAHGPADDVVTFLEELTRWLAAPDLSRVAEESRVLQAEVEYRGTGDAAVALLQRYGARGPGLCGYTEPGLGRASAERLAAHVARRFAADNAVLVLDGPPPPTLRLHLPAGTRLPVEEPPSSTDPRPAAYPTTGRLVLSGELDRSYAATVLPGVLQHRLRSDLRDTAGGAYAPWASYEAVGPDRAVVLAGSDVSQAFLGTVVRQAQATLRSLVENGPHEGVVEDVLAQIVQHRTDPYQAVGFAYSEALATLESRPVEEPEEVLAGLSAVTRDEVAELLDGFGSSLLLGVPGEARWEDEFERLSMPTRPTPLSGRRHRSREFPADRGQVIVGSEGVAVGSGEVWQQIRASDVAAVMAFPDGGRHVVAHDGWGVMVEPTLWRAGNDAADAVDRLVPADLRIPMPPREPQRVPRPAPLASVLRRSARPALVVVVTVLVVVAAAFGAGSFVTEHPPLVVPLVVGLFVGIREWLTGRRRSS